MKKIFFLFAVILLIACNDSRDSEEWLITVDEVLDGGPGKDGIPSVDSPEFEPTSTSSYLNPNDLVIGIIHNGIAKAYPHRILDWHEIINDHIGDRNFALTYCPLTGTGSVWNRNINNTITTFGVSGKLYNTNLMPYDRATDSYWSQLRLDCVNGSLINTTAETFPMIETTWATWKKYFPDSFVMTTETGFSRDYSDFPYGDYRTNHSNIIFPVNNEDNRLPAKERILAILTPSDKIVYSIEQFESDHVISDQIENREALIFGSKAENYITAFYNDGLSNVQISNDAQAGYIAMDDAGNKISLSGEIIEGPMTGKQLEQVESILGYYFAIAAFYPSIPIYN